MASSIFIFILLGLVVFISIIRYSRKCVEKQQKIKRSRCRNPPQLPQLDRFFGLDIIFKRLHSIKQNRSNITIKSQHQMFGSTFQAKPWLVTVTFTIDPENLKSIYATNWMDWGNEPMRLFAHEPLTGKGIMNTDGPYWEFSRALVKPLFARKQVANLDALERHVEKLIQAIPKDRSTVDLQPLFSRLAFDSATEFFFGRPAGCLDPANHEARSLLNAYAYAQVGLGKRMMLPRWNCFTRDKRFWSSCKSARSYINSQIDKITQGAGPTKSGGRYMLAQEIALRTSDIELCRNQVTNLFFPAYDGIGAALTNIFFNLARHPAVYCRLHQEVRSIGSSKLSFEQLKSMKYLQYVMNETFRLTPPIGMNARVALKDTALPKGGGPDGQSPVFIAKGDIVSTHFFSLNQRKDIFGDDAEEFRPERWTYLRPPHWSFIPFGGGPRVCPGQQLVLTETAFTVVRILQKFNAIENRDPVLEFVEQFQITTISKNGAKVGLVPILE